MSDIYRLVPTIELEGSIRAIEEHITYRGDGELDMEDEIVTFRELLDPLNEAEYGSARRVEAAIIAMIGDEVIGRKNYSDRTPPAPGEDRQDEVAPEQEGQREQVSL